MNRVARLMVMIFISTWIGSLAGCGTAENENISDEDFEKILEREYKAESAVKPEKPED
jgi:hypothetical protein